MSMLNALTFQMSQANDTFKTSILGMLEKLGMESDDVVLSLLPLLTDPAVSFIIAQCISETCYYVYVHAGRRQKCRIQCS